MSAVRWAAYRDGVAHALTGLPRTSCGRHVMPEVYEWPEKTRCAECRRLNPQEVERQSREEQQMQRRSDRMNRKKAANR